MIEDIQVAIPLGLLLSLMIGPVFFVLMETSATKGFRAGLSVDLGVIIADIVFITIAYFSSYQLIEDLSNQPGLFVLGGMIISIYGLILYFKKKVETKEVKANKGTYLALAVKGFLLNFINVGVLVFWLVVVIVVVPSLDNNTNRVITFFTTVIAVYFSIDIIKILLAKQLKKKLTDAKIVMAKKILGVILVICGVVIIVKGFIPYNIQGGIDRMESTIKK